MYFIALKHLGINYALAARTTNPYKSIVKGYRGDESWDKTENLSIVVMPLSHTTPQHQNWMHSLCLTVSAAELCKALALLHTRYFSFAPAAPKLKGLELLSIPNIDLAADVSIWIPLPQITGFGCHLQSNTHSVAPKIAQLSSSLGLTTRYWQG